MTLFPYLILGCYLTLFSAAALTNRTIDDQNGDSVTGLLPSYTPADQWSQGATCPPANCFVQLDTEQVFDGTWHDTTYLPGGDPRTISLSFNGTAVYVYFVLGTFLTNLSVTVDSEVVGQYVHIPDAGASSTDYHYGIPVYVNTALSNSQHTLTLEATGTNSSLLLFDYAIYSVDDDEPPLSSVSGSTTASVSGLTTASVVGSSTSSVPNSTGSSRASSTHPAVPAITTPTTPQPSTAATTTNPGPRTIAVGMVIAGALILIVSLLIIYLRRRRNNRRRLEGPRKDLELATPYPIEKQPSITPPGLSYTGVTVTGKRALALARQVEESSREQRPLPPPPPPPSSSTPSRSGGSDYSQMVAEVGRLKEEVGRLQARQELILAEGGLPEYY